MQYSITRISSRTKSAALGRWYVQRLAALGWLVDWKANPDGTITFWFQMTINS